MYMGRFGSIIWIWIYIKSFLPKKNWESDSVDICTIPIPMEVRYWGEPEKERQICIKWSLCPYLLYSLLGFFYFCKNDLLVRYKRSIYQSRIPSCANYSLYMMKILLPEFWFHPFVWFSIQDLIRVYPSFILPYTGDSWKFMTDWFRIFDTRRNVTNPLDREKKARALPCHFWVLPSLNDSLDKKDSLLPICISNDYS
jgi:hypothetical protein